MTNMPNKLRFYNFLNHMINCMRENSIGKIKYNWEKIDWMKKQVDCINFYDEAHTFPRLTIVVEKKGNKLYFETLPF